MHACELMHYGILGMRWGVRRTEEQLAKARGSKKGNPKKEENKKATKNISEMSDEEIRRAIERLDLERRYKEILRQPMSEAQEKSNRGKKLVTDILENSARNIGSQTVTYVMGTAVNKALASVFDDPHAINPKKGQKEK